MIAARSLATASTTPSRRSRSERVGVVAVDLRHDQVLPDGALEHLGGAFGHDPAAGDDADAVGQGVGLLQILGGEEDGSCITGDMISSCTFSQQASLLAYGLLHL